MCQWHCGTGQSRTGWQLNPDKSEAISCVTSRRQHQLPTAVIPIVGVRITPSRGPSVISAFISMQICGCGCTSNERCRGVLLVFANYATSAEQYQHAATFQMLVLALVHSRLVRCSRPTDWHCSLYLVRRVYTVGAQCSVTTHLPSASLLSHLWCVGDTALHWLYIPERVQCKVAVLTYKLLHGSAARYLEPLVAVAGLPGRRALQSASKLTSKLVVPTHQTLYCWQPCFSNHRSPSLKQSARGRRLIVITADFTSSFKNSSFSTVIPSSHSWLLDWHRYSGLCSNVSLFIGHSKNWCLLTCIPLIGL